MIIFKFNIIAVSNFLYYCKLFKVMIEYKIFKLKCRLYVADKIDFVLIVLLFGMGKIRMEHCRDKENNSQKYFLWL